MKYLVIGLLAVSMAWAEEKPRQWTDATGRTMTGILVEKDQAEVRILVKGRSFRIPIKSLSEEDQQYIAEADVYPKVKLKSATMSVQSNEAYSQADRRQVKVTVEGSAGRKLKVRVVWIGKQIGGKKPVFHATELRDVESDGDMVFSSEYTRKGGKTRDYRGYAVGVQDEEGQWLEVTASLEPYKRFVWEYLDPKGN